jgi:hypothetical protein
MSIGWTLDRERDSVTKATGNDGQGSAMRSTPVVGAAARRRRTVVAA